MVLWEVSVLWGFDFVVRDVKVMVPIYIYSLFMEDLNSWISWTTKTMKIEPPRKLMISQYNKITKTLFLQIFCHVAFIKQKVRWHSTNKYRYTHVPTDPYYPFCNWLWGNDKILTQPVPLDTSCHKWPIFSCYLITRISAYKIMYFTPYIKFIHHNLACTIDLMKINQRNT